MQKNQINHNLPYCLKCSQQIKPDSPKLQCRICQIKLHYHCLLDIFPTYLIPTDTDYQWDCFKCSSQKTIEQNCECMFCGQNAGFLIKMELESQDYVENTKFKWGHWGCIEKRSSCIKEPENNCFRYKNVENYLKRQHCKACKELLNIECNNCRLFFLHFPCARSKSKTIAENCSDCLKMMKREKTAAATAQKKLNIINKKMLLDDKIIEEENIEIIKINQDDSLKNITVIENETSAISVNPTENLEGVIKEELNEEEMLKKSKQMTTPFFYKTKAPDLLIELLNSIMKFDRLALLRKDSLAIDFENSEPYLKSQEKYSEIHYNFNPEFFLNYSDLSQKYLTFQTQEYRFEYGSNPDPIKITTKYNNIDVIHDKATKNIYFSFKEFEKDLIKMFYTVMTNRCISKASSNYITSLIEYYLKCLKVKKYPTTFLSVKLQDINNIVSQETGFKLPCSNWPVIPKSFRHYVTIDEYTPVDPKQNVTNDLKSYKKPVKCPEGCACWNYETLGEFSYELCTWVSTCPNRAQQIECDSTSHPGCCKNMAIGSKQRKILGSDVEERLSWGIDIYTRKNIFLVLPENKDEIDTKYDFIQNKLMKAINLQKENGFNMEIACNFILEKTKNNTEDNMFDKRDRKYAKILLKAVHLNQDPEAFRIHSKGQGLICINKNGFKKNEFIVEYFGEIYPPWNWYEKQDKIKKYLKDNNKRNVLLDFYNIMMEIHKNDPKGYNIFFIDPIHKGNYSSRLSHCCDPNCGTVTTIVNGQYVIGMYAMKDINYGEELTFDYCSVTEDQNELKKAFCLCGSRKCRGKYLELIKTKESNTFIEQVHSFLERNNIILKACREVLVEKDFLIFEKFNLRERVLENMPDWLKKWLSLTLEFVENERAYILETSNEKIRPGLPPEEEKRQRDINEFLAHNNQESRIQNLVITCDKVKYFLKKTGNNDAPFMLLTSNQIYELLWGKLLKVPIPEDVKDTSVINDVLKTFYLNRNIPEINKCIHFIYLIDKLIQSLVVKDSPRACSLIRFAFLMLSNLLKDLCPTDLTSARGFHKNAMADTLYFYAFTHTYFKAFEYNTTQGETVYVRRCDVSNVETYIKESHSLEIDGGVVENGRKSYKGTVLWGQLVGWFKQTVVNPEASLSQDRRGTLSNPVFSGSFLNFGLEYPFQKKTEMNVIQARDDFFSHLKKKPSYSWPPLSAKWSFKNPQKTYGTLLFENQILKDRFPNYLTIVLDTIDSPPTKQFELLENNEGTIENLFSFGFIDLYEKYLKEIKDIKGDECFAPKNGIEKRKRVSQGSQKSIKQGLNIINTIKEEEDKEIKSPKLVKKKKSAKMEIVKKDIKNEEFHAIQRQENGKNSPKMDTYKIKQKSQIQTEALG